MSMSKKHYFAFLIALPALFIVVLLRLIPLAGGVMTAFKEYSVIKGINASPWNGGANFSKLFNGPAFRQVLGNTLYINANVILTALILGLVLGLILSYLKNKRLFMVFCIIFLLPFFIPQIYWNVLILKLFSTQGWLRGTNAEPRLYLADGRIVRSLYIFIEVIRWSGIFASLVGFAVRRALHQGRFKTAAKAAFSILLISAAFILVTDFEMLHPLVNPLVYEKVDTLSLFEFRTGMMTMDISTSSALWFLKSLYCFAVLVVLLFVADRFINNSILPLSNNIFSVDRPDSNGGNAAAVIISSIYSIFLIFLMLLVIFALSGLGARVSTDLFFKNGVIYTILALISTTLGILLSVLLAYPLTTASPGARKAYLIIFILLLAAGQFGMHEYIFIKSLGIVNTYFAILLTGIFNPVSVILIGEFYNKKSDNTPSSFGQFVRTSLPAIAAIFLATLLLNMDSYTGSLIYINRADMQAPSAQIYMGMQLRN